jgi:hypothetical protein
MRNSDFFKGIMQWEFDWQGEKGRLPVFYYENSSMSAIYTASTDKVRKLLPKEEMHPIEVFPGRCLAAFTAFEYRDTDIRPYNEFSVSFLITYGKKSVPGLKVLSQMSSRHFSTYVWQLPVTTEIARVGGVDMYGYPKFLADIVWTRTNDWVECRLSEQGRHILTLGGKMLPAKPCGHFKYTTYSVKNGIPLVANVLINPLEFAQSRNKKDAKLTLGDAHAICDALHGIELSPNPLMYQYLPNMEAILFGGRNMVDG